MLVKIAEHVFRGGVSDFVRGGFVGNPESGVQADFVKIRAQNIRAEFVYRGNARRRNFFQGFADFGVIPARYKSFSERGDELLFHFRRGGFGERYGENFRNPCFSVQNEAYKPFYHNERFAAPRGSGNEHISFRFAHGAPLIRRKFIFILHCLRPPSYRFSFLCLFADRLLSRPNKRLQRSFSI